MASPPIRLAGERRKTIEAATQLPTKSELIEKAGDVKVLPTIASKVVQVVNNGNSSAHDLTEVIEKDAAITVRILKIANSPLYGLKNEVRDVRHAVSLLGFSAVQSLVMAASTKGLHKNSGIVEHMMWDHSVGAAVAARILCWAGGFGGPVQDVAFLAGLLHDIGKVVLNNETPHLYAEVSATVYNEKRSSIDVEREVYGYDHAEIGAGVLQRWGLSPQLVAIVGNHHETVGEFGTMEDDLSQKGAAVVNLADQICKKLGIGYREPDDELALDGLSSTTHLKLAPKVLEEAVIEIQASYETEKTLFS